MKLVNINLNEYIHFELTPHGKKIWSASDSRMLSYPTKLQFHEFMNIFGAHLYNGCEMPIKDCNVKIEVGDG